MKFLIETIRTFEMQFSELTLMSFRISLGLAAFIVKGARSRKLGTVPNIWFASRYSQLRRNGIRKRSVVSSEANENQV